MRGIYSNNEVSAPPWAMQALFRCAGNSVMSVAEAKVLTNWESMFPKCSEALPKRNHMFNNLPNP